MIWEKKRCKEQMKEREGRIKRYNEQKMDGMRNEGMWRTKAEMQFTNEGIWWANEEMQWENEGMNEQIKWCIKKKWKRVSNKAI
jgi:hypothetical protein